MADNNRPWLSHVQRKNAIKTRSEAVTGDANLLENARKATELNDANGFLEKLGLNTPKKPGTSRNPFRNQPSSSTASIKPRFKLSSKTEQVTNMAAIFSIAPPPGNNDEETHRKVLIKQNLAKKLRSLTNDKGLKKGEPRVSVAENNSGKELTSPTIHTKGHRSGHDYNVGLARELPTTNPFSRRKTKHRETFDRNNSAPRIMELTSDQVVTRNTLKMNPTTIPNDSDRSGGKGSERMSTHHVGKLDMSTVETRYGEERKIHIDTESNLDIKIKPDFQYNNEETQHFESRCGAERNCTTERGRHGTQNKEKAKRTHSDRDHYNTHSTEISVTPSDIAVLGEVEGFIDTWEGAERHVLSIFRRGHKLTRARKQQGDHPPGFRLGAPQSNATEEEGKTTQSGKMRKDEKRGRRKLTAEEDIEEDRRETEKDNEKKRRKTEKGKRTTKKGEEKDRRKTTRDDEKHRRKTEQDNEKERRETEKDEGKTEKVKKERRKTAEKDKEKDRRPETDRDKRKDRKRTDSRNLAERTRKGRHRKRTGSSIRTTRQGSRSNRRKCAFRKDAKQTQQMDTANASLQSIDHLKGEKFEEDGKISYFRNTNITSQNGVDSYNSTQTVNSSRRHSRRLIARKRRRQCFRGRGRKRRRHNASKSKGRKGELRQIKPHLTKTLSNKEEAVVTPVTSPPSHNKSTVSKQAVFGTVNNSHKENVSPKVPLDSCPENRTTNSPNLPLNVRSVCPWSYYVDHDPDRFPYDILQARCRCIACLDTTTNRQNYNYVCVPVTIQKLVSRRKKKKSGRGYRYRNEWVNVAVGCTCVNPRYSP
ncbi:PREDICTED: serine/arginine repetitive matrix protein 5-like [Branchiostoma belcheri]|uniref:Serine/arginine repetitive matrix protein 5-like n=1 Tax=Branchiostoma belcheri TaxID=7741 RepID=A0A6P4YBQ5_BRABE|nr:PREDICTED: serine/arginine repetitive matrix protein 5-like [Branchiostoma belcheri]